MKSRIIVQFIFLLILIAPQLHAGRNFSKKISFYVALFSQTDPETVFLDENKKFKHKDFELTYTEFLKSLTKNPEQLYDFKFKELIPFLRAIVSYYRFDEKIGRLILELPLDAIFKELHRGFIELYVTAKNDFENTFATPRSFTLEEVKPYLQLENDVILTGEIISFICFINRDSSRNIEDITEFERVIAAHITAARFRLKLMVAKHITLKLPGYEQMQNMAHDEKSAFYQFGARFNIAGQTISDYEAPELENKDTCVAPESFAKLPTAENMEWDA